MVCKNFDGQLEFDPKIKEGLLKIKGKNREELIQKWSNKL